MRGKTLASPPHLRASHQVQVHEAAAWQPDFALDLPRQRPSTKDRGQASGHLVAHAVEDRGDAGRERSDLSTEPVRLEPKWLRMNMMTMMTTMTTMTTMVNNDDDDDDTT